MENRKERKRLRIKQRKRDEGRTEGETSNLFMMRTNEWNSGEINGEKRGIGRERKRGKVTDLCGGGAGEKEPEGGKGVEEWEGRAMALGSQGQG